MVNIRKLIARIGKDPALLNELLSKQHDKDRKDILTKHGLIAGNATGPSKEEVRAEIMKMLTPASAPSPAPTGQRYAGGGWVVAIGTAAAGAAAGACSGDS